MLFTSIILFTSDTIRPAEKDSQVYTSQKHKFRVVKVLTNLEYPWALAFLPDKSMLITERSGFIKLYDGKRTFLIKNVPKVDLYGQGGLLDIALHPDFVKNRYLFITYSKRFSNGEIKTVLARAKLISNNLSNLTVIFKMNKGGYTGRHFGARIAFLKDKTLLLSLGERGEKKRAQDLKDHAGSLIRINTDGSVPKNNPFANNPAAMPEIYSYGHRNAQGLLVDKRNNKIYLHEHGPKGGDEINIVNAGKNYGWPVITYGRSYAGFKIGKGTHQPGMEQPLLHWTPSIAPSGFMLYTGNKFKNWKYNFFVGALAKKHLRRVVVKNNKIYQEVLLKNKLGRIRDVRQGPNGYIWILTDHIRGTLYRLEPLK
jgi:glucose/arabinose dehydrogenase